jgi:ELWxxDGT repeat protein
MERWSYALSRLLGLCLAFAAPAAAAGNAYRVKDINTVDDPSASSPIGPGAVAANAFFFQVRALYDRQPPELWRTDGTPDGTKILSHTGFDAFAVLDDTFFFLANDQLWRSDGTAAGTRALAHVGWTFSSKLVATGRALFFTTEEADGTALWTSDGSREGTRKLTVGELERFGPLKAVGDTLFFSRPDPQTGCELWRIDDRTFEMKLVKDICPGSLSSIDSFSRPAWVASGGLLFFAAADGAGSELWRSDGTPQGTFRVKDVSPGQAGSEFGDVVDANGTVFFTVRGDLWKTNGTEAGTVFLRHEVGYLAPMDSKVFFLTSSFSDNTAACRLWASDGTPAGTGEVANLCAGATTVWIDLGVSVAHDHELYFVRRAWTGTGSPQQREIWKTDGTPVGTVLVSSLDPIQDGWDAYGLVFLKDVLFFVADDGVNGRELWRTDGTPQGTVRLTQRINNSAFAPGQPAIVPAGGRTVFFAASEPGTGLELWQSDGTEAGTHLVDDLVPGPDSSSPDQLTPFKGGVLFTARQSHPPPCWPLRWSDGTAAGTRILGPCFAYAGAPRFPIFKGDAYFISDGRRGDELWKTDGTPEGTRLVTAQPGTAGFLDDLTVAGHLLFFTASTNMNQTISLWRSDGTAEGTVLLKEKNVSGLHGGGRRLFFVATDARGTELWRSDGTPEGTTLVKDICPGPCGSMYAEVGSALMSDAGGLLYFEANDGVHGFGLWRSDGTEAGTFLLKDTAPVSAFSAPETVISVNGKALFFAPVGDSDVGLWKTDGTEVGTQPLVALDGAWPPGRAGVATGNQLYFASGSPALGAEPWAADAWHAGPLTDVAPGDAPSDPRGFTLAGDLLYFVAHDGKTGDELWALPLATLSALGTSVTEDVCSSPTAVVPVTLSAASPVPVTVHYATVDGTARAGEDYVASAGTLTFAPDQTRQYVRVPIVSDRVLEKRETFSVLLSEPTVVPLARGRAVVTIFDRPQPRRCSVGAAR